MVGHSRTDESPPIAGVETFRLKLFQPQGHKKGVFLPPTDRPRSGSGIAADTAGGEYVSTKLSRLLVGVSAAFLVATAVVIQFNVPASAQTQRATAAGVRIDPDDIGGVVNSSKGPEAGVWVIAETTSLPTKFHKIVVTDDQGRFVL